MVKKWTKDEEKILRKLFPINTLADLLSAFPDRTGDSIDKKAYKLGLKKSANYDPNKGQVVTNEHRVAKILAREKFPIDTGELIERSGLALTERKLIRIISNLRDEGYDIMEVESGAGTSYSFVRTAGYDPEAYYNFHGEIETPVLMTGDWHIGNKYHARHAFESMLNAIDEYSVATVMIVGDMFQGMGVYRTEAADLSIKNLQKQVEVGRLYLSEIPKCVKDIGIVIGNHEIVAKGKHEIGYDMCKAVTLKEPRAHYYGPVGKVLLDGDWDYTMMHSMGSVGYAVSYKGQKIRDNLIQRPHILHLGHIHQPYNVPRPHICGGANTITSASLKRESGWEMMRGWTSIVGWYILNKWTPTHVSVDEFRPRVR